LTTGPLDENASADATARASPAVRTREADATWGSVIEAVEVLMAGIRTVRSVLSVHW
jgi:hypothetical protein